MAQAAEAATHSGFPGQPYSPDPSFVLRIGDMKMPKTEVFLSHKAKDGLLAKQIRDVLTPLLSDLNFFLSEEIDKSKDFRDEILKKLAKARFFILLYTDPSEDWSWCFFEAGAFHSARPEKGARQRQIYCLHTKDSLPPGPLANLQTIQAKAADIKLWIKDISKLLKRRAPSNSRIDDAARRIESAVKARSILVERSIKPNIWITPRWPNQTQPNFNKADLPPIPLENAVVNIDPESANRLGFASAPDGMELMPFLKMLDCDSGDWDSGGPYWLERFFKSLTKAIQGSLNLQEVAYFRHEGGGIYRPVVVGVAKSRDGGCCRLRVVFIHAFSAPLTDHPTAVQRLADGIRLSIRTRIEVINGFSGRLSRMYDEKVKSTAPADQVARNYSVGRRVMEALQTVTEEAEAHGMRPSETPPILFSDPAEQDEYERIRSEGVQIWKDLKNAADAEDKARTGSYVETEKLLLGLKRLNDRYLKLALPRLNVLSGSICGIKRDPARPLPRIEAARNASAITAPASVE
jgi:hypothetical protein